MSTRTIRTAATLIAVMALSSAARVEAQSPFIAPEVLTPAAPWGQYGGDYGSMAHVRYPERVLVWGLARLMAGSGPIPSGGSLIGQLPQGHGPCDRLIFSVASPAGSARVDVLPDGQIRLLPPPAGSDATLPAWVSLAGINFLARGGDGRGLLPVCGTPLPLGTGVTHFGGVYGSARFASTVETIELHAGTRSEATVHLTGVVRPAAGASILGRLPEGARPTGRLVFNVRSSDGDARVDVLADGSIELVTHTRADQPVSWVSLAGISFDTSRPLLGFVLVNEWVPYGGDYDPPRWHGDRWVTLRGLVKGGKWDSVVKLPSGFRPAARLVFLVNNHGSPARVDVLPDGQVKWVAGGKDHGWLSLAGIRFQRPPREICVVE